MEITPTDPDDFLASIEDDADRSAMLELDALIVAALPGRARVMWEGVMWGGTEQSIIGYGHIVQPRPRGDDVEWFLVGLARQKAHLSVYVNAAEEGEYLGQRFADRLGSVKLGSASIAIKRLSDLDLDGFDAMLRRADALTPADPRI